MALLVGDVFRNAARAVPDRVAAALGDDALTFAQLDARGNAIANALAAQGAGRGSLVAVWSATDLDVVPVFVGLAKIGAVFAPLNPAFAAGEARGIVDLARPVAIVADADRLAPAREIAAGRIVSLADLRDASDAAEPSPATLTESDPHAVFFTSGSTGRPKGAVLSHRVNVLRTHPGALLEPRGAMVCPYPTFHMAAWTIALQQWQARDRVVFLPSADAETICAAVERHAAARLNCIPAVWSRILGHLGDCRHDLSSIRLADTGTSATPLALLEAMEAALPGARIRVFYGSTEAGSVSSLDHVDIRRKPGSVGVPAPWAEARVDDTGELWVRGPLLFDGYFNDPDATAKALVDGWYRTGDLAEIDDDGYITIVGRTGHIIRTAGESVSPTEVEEVLATHPDIADVAVVGIPDDRWGELVCAVVVPAAAVPTIAELRAHCEGRLAAFKHPRRVAVVDSIPRTTATGQVQRRLLAESLAMS